MMWNINEWWAALSIATALIGAAGYLVRLYLRNFYATKTDLDDHGARLTLLSKRTEALEAQSNLMATRDDVQRVLIAIERSDGARSALAADLSGVKDLLAAFQRQLNLIQQALLSENAR
jgi:hypothetical protein